VALGRGLYRPAHIHYEVHHPDLITPWFGEIYFKGDSVIPLDYVGAKIAHPALRADTSLHEDPEDATAWSLARLNTLFFHHYDRREYDEVLDLFTPDARYEVHGRKLRGHAEILDVLNARPGPELTARHLITNQHFHTIGDATAQGTVTLIGYGGPTPADEGPAPYPVAKTGRVVELNDHYRLDNGHWKITHRTAQPILAPAPA
jgi:hypothetical protein